MPTLRIGSRGQDVRQAQLLLNSLMHPYPLLRVDGDFGRRTDEVLRQFQAARGLEVDGALGPQTRAALGLRPESETLPPTPTPPPPATATGSRNWLDIAAAEIGVRENSAPGQHTDRIVEYHATTSLRATDDETAWCSSFVNWVVTQSGQRGTNSAAARSWIPWGADARSPQRGCIVVIKRRAGGFTSATGSHSGYHVGFLESATATTLRILGGNQSNQVRYSNFAIASYEPQAYRIAGA